MQEPLEELLKELRQAIDACEEGTGDREELARLAGQVEDRLREENDENIVDELREEVTRFEVTHPGLANVIGRTADALSALGL